MPQFCIVVTEFIVPRGVLSRGGSRVLRATMRDRKMPVRMFRRETNAIDSMRKSINFTYLGFCFQKRP